MRNTDTPKKDPLPDAARGTVPRPASQASIDVLSAKVDKLMAVQEQILAILTATPPSVPSPSTLAPLAANVDTVARQVYESTLRAIHDKEEYEEKEKRVVVIGSKESENPAESLANDEKLVQSLVEYSGDPLVKKAWEDGQIRHHRHPKDNKPNRRPLKIELPSKTLRDSLLNGIRNKPGRPAPLPAPSFIRRDLTPHQLQLEREAREEVRKKNIEAGSLSFGLRDYSVISYSRPRPLPDNYGIPRAPLKNTAADFIHSGNGTTALSTDASSIASPAISTAARDSHVNVAPRGAARR